MVYYVIGGIYIYLLAADFLISPHYFEHYVHTQTQVILISLICKLK